MKALTLTQPWASLVILGAKRFETRKWKTAHRGPLAIHAARGFPEAAKALAVREPFQQALFGSHDPCPEVLPFGALLGVVEVAGCCRTEEVAAAKDAEHSVELAFGDFTPGRYAWELRLLKRFAEPIPVAGHLGLWDVPDKLLLGVWP